MRPLPHASTSACATSWASVPDVAVRKLNVVDFESPLGKELGSRLEALPYLIVFTPSGKRIDIAGADMEKLDKALAAK